jgi:hypothetical protein
MRTSNITDGLCEIARGVGTLSYLAIGWCAFHLMPACLHLALKAISS